MTTLDFRECEKFEGASIFTTWKCWTLVSMLPASFATWVNPLSWILTMAIVAEITPTGFVLLAIIVQQMVSERHVSSSKLARHVLGGRLLDIGLNASQEFRDMD